MGDYRAGLVVELGILQPAFPTSSLPQPVMLDAVTSRVVGCQGVLLQDGAAPAQTYLIHRGPAWMLPLASRRADATVGNEKGSVEEVIAGSPQPRGQYGLLAVERDERVYGTIQCPRPAPKGARIDDAGWIGSALDPPCAQGLYLTPRAFRGLLRSAAYTHWLRPTTPFRFNKSARAAAGTLPNSLGSSLCSPPP